LITKKNSAGLISGAYLKLKNIKEFQMADKKIDITVTRRFRYEGKKIEPGKYLTVERHFANEMISASKAVEGHVKLKDEPKKPAA